MLGPVVRTFGNLLNMVAALARPTSVLVGTLVKIVALPLEAILGGLAAVLEVLMAPLTAVGELLSRLAEAFDKFITRAVAGIRNLLGLPTMAGRSVGAAVRPANFSGTEDYERQQFAKAFSIGTGGPRTAPGRGTLRIP